MGVVLGAPPAGPHRLLAEVAALLPVGGSFVVVEAEDMPWFLPASTVDTGGTGGAADGRPGLESRLNELLGAPRTETLLDVGSDRGAALRAAGSHLAVEDAATLDVLLAAEGPESLAQREDVAVRTTRRAWIAQRPGARCAPHADADARRDGGHYPRRGDHHRDGRTAAPPADP